MQWRDCVILLHSFESCTIRHICYYSEVDSFLKECQGKRFEVFFFFALELKVFKIKELPGTKFRLFSGHLLKTFCH